MNFLKFLKKEKKKEYNELDLPPTPPALEGFDNDMPELPDFSEFKEELPSQTSEESPSFEFPRMEEEMPSLDLQSNIPDFPVFPEVESKSITPTPMVSTPSTSAKPTPPAQKLMFEPEQEAISKVEQIKFKPTDISPKTGRRLFEQEKRVLRQRPSGKTIYVKVDNFKAMLGSINIVRSDLRKSEGALMKLETMKSSKDKAFDKVKSSLDDLQKKLIFIDKTLFKGE